MRSADNAFSVALRISDIGTLVTLVSPHGEGKFKRPRDRGAEPFTRTTWLSSYKLAADIPASEIAAQPGTATIGIVKQLRKAAGPKPPPIIENLVNIL